MIKNQLQIYQAPLQGFTDFTYRRILADTFGGVDKYFIPYLSYGKGREIKKSQLREVFPENNTGLPVVAQVLFSDSTELLELVNILTDHGHSEINLNLGCPYPMATNKGRGAAWLEKPELLDALLHDLFSKNIQAQFSVKMRAGLTDEQNFKAILGVLNQFPLTEIIFHPRTASQMYTGTANQNSFAEALGISKHPMVYNGDLSSEEDMNEFRKIMPDQNAIMIGRGLLKNPALAIQLKGEIFDEKLLRKKLRDFHDQLMDAYAERLQGGGHLLMKMNQFWEYFSESFGNPRKAMKLIKKSSSILKYNASVVEIFRSL